MAPEYKEDDEEAGDAGRFDGTGEYSRYGVNGWAFKRFDIA